MSEEQQEHQEQAQEQEQQQRTEESHAESNYANTGAAAATTEGERPAFSRPPSNVDDLVTLKVSGISYDTNTATLREVFDKFGPVADVYIPKDRDSGRSRGFAFVRFADRAHADQAQKEVDATTIDGRQISVAEAQQPRRERRDGGGYGGRSGGYGGGRGGGGYGGDRGYGGGGGGYRDSRRDRPRGGRSRPRDERSRSR